MTVRKILTTASFASVAAVGLILGLSSVASAQVISCPGGYAYSYGAGCVPVAPGYAAVYAQPPRVYEPPIYDPLVIAFGGGHDRGHFDHRHFDHGHGGHSDHGHR